MLAVVTRWQAGTLTFGDFWDQHSEHRIAVLKGMVWAVGAATDFDVVAAMRIGFALSAIKLALLIDLIRRSLRGHARHLIAPLALVASLLMFSLVQHEDWFWATTSLQFSLLNLCTVMLVWGLACRPDSWTALAVAIGSAVLAIFTEISGHVLWVTGGLAVWFFTQRRARGAQRLAVWLAAATTMSLIYMWNLRWAPSANATTFLESPGRFLAWTGALLGLPFAFWMPVRWAAVVGFAGTIPLVLGTRWLYKSNRPLLASLLPFLLFALHGMLVCILIAVGRSGGDPNSALTSHYSFAPNLYWVAVLTISAAAASVRLSAATSRHRLMGLAAAGTAALCLAASFAEGNIVGYQKAYTRSRNLQMARAALSSTAEIPRPVLRFLYPPDEERARTLVTQLRAARLGPFSSSAGADDMALASPSTPVPAGPAADGFLDGGDCLGTTGWAWDPAHPDTPVTLDVWSGESLLGTVTADWFRWDLLATGRGNGQHAFRFVFPAQGSLGTGRAVTVRFAGTNRGLRGSPTTVYCRD